MDVQNPQKINNEDGEERIEAAAGKKEVLEGIGRAQGTPVSKMKRRSMSAESRSPSKMLEEREELVVREIKSALLVAVEKARNYVETNCIQKHQEFLLKKIERVSTNLVLWENEWRKKCEVSRLANRLYKVDAMLKNTTPRWTGRV